jgi:hypothetical protein
MSSYSVRETVPILVTRVFEDKKGVFYPRCIRVLVIVERFTPETWFPFGLRLERKLRVSVRSRKFHHDLQDSITKLKGLGAQHDGWCFRIRGKYKSHLAKGALEDVESTEKNKIIGLYPAAEPWREAQRQCVNNYI